MRLFVASVPVLDLSQCPRLERLQQQPLAHITSVLSQSTILVWQICAGSVSLQLHALAGYNLQVQPLLSMQHETASSSSTGKP